MQLFDFVSVKLTLFLIFGIIIGFYWGPPLWFTGISLLLCLGLTYLGWKKQSVVFGISAAGITLFLGIFITTISLGKALHNHYTHKKIEDESSWHLKIQEVLKPNAYSHRFVAQVISQDQNKSVGKLLFYLSSDTNGRIPIVDDEIIVLSSAQEIKPPRNPYQFNYRDYLRKQGIFHQISSKPKGILYLERPSSTIYGYAMAFREHIISKLHQHPFGSGELAVIQALLLGKRSDISKEMYDNYKNAGAVHILAVSGLHVGILLLILQFLTSPLKRLSKGKTIQMGIVLIMLWGFAFMAGLSPSIVRAVTMFSFVAYALNLNRPTNPFNIVALSMFFILLVKPLFLFQVGFQMSYIAVLSILWIYPKLQKFYTPDQFLVRKLWQLLSISFAAQLGVLPISLYYFHQFPALFFVSNLLIIPFLGIILGMGLLVIALALVNILPSFLTITFNFIIKSMNWAIGWIAQQEQFVLKEIPFDGVQLMLTYPTIIALVVFLSKPSFKKILIPLSGIIGLQLWGIKNQIQSRNHQQLVIAHSAKTPLLLYQSKKRLLAFSKDSSRTKATVKNFQMGQKAAATNYYPLQNNYRFGNKRFYRVDSFAILPKQRNLDILWMTDSPKINLARWLDSLQPKQVISDGTNYKSYSSRWKKTCQKKKVPFHDTREKGAYILNWFE
ncbi:ComEC/Rec2 family competence protein [Flagellimonas allohymeniacidonis]|uniref:ComEC family competence protein n=1 Tax=Flagellimonas allohymeniacidonis TaxID=2517819 RepID=A0A4Q8QE66_9FLAO|nr:ComEC/Rec2 family competence protein [Allomuricauda hymeniacidonis]TAI48044.1 ComEC family competence protein [Allomuricauda hymeniacidonis]